MSAGAAVFMTLSWAFVLGLACWSLWRVQRRPQVTVPDREERPADA